MSRLLAWFPRQVCLPILLVLSAAAGLIGLSAPSLQAGWIPFADGRVLWVWGEPLRIAGAALVLVALTLATWRALRGGPQGLDNGPIGHALAPLAWMPVLPLVLHARPLLPQTLAATAAFWGLAGIIAVIAARAYARLAARPTPPRHPVLATFIVVSLFYTGVGTYFTRVAGPHSGDENHYITIARSLHQDGDLDIKNQVRCQGEHWRANYHISPASRESHWYSEHPVGLSLLLWPVVDVGLVWRHLVLGLIAGAGSAGLLRLALTLGAPMASALLVTTLTSFGMFWGIYSCRALPEVLGAAFTVWMVVGILTQPQHPWRSMIPVLLAVSCLPWAHIRFMPVGLLGFGFYGLLGLWRPRSWPTTLLRLTAFTALAALGLALYYWPQHLMFRGASSYAEKGVIFAFPRGIWETLAGNRGILVAMPAFVWMWWTSVRAFVVSREQRFAHGVILAMTIAVLCTSCATIWFTAGSCLPGRFLIVVTPLIAASAATGYHRSSRTARGLFLLLSGYAMALFLLWVLNLSRTGAGFVQPLRTLGWHLSALGQMLDPLREPHDPGFHRFAMLLHAVILLLVVGAAWPRWIPRALLILLALGAVVSHVARPPIVITVDPGQAARRLTTHLSPATRVVGRAPEAAVSLFTLVDRYSGPRAARAFTGVTTAAGTVTDADRRWSGQAQLPVNDWSERPLAWATLVKPFPVPAGRQTVSIEGTLTGTATLQVAIRCGSHTVREEAAAPDATGRIVFCHEFTPPARGDLYLLARLEGADATFTLDNIHWAPTPTGLLRALNLQLPAPAPPAP